MLVTSFCYDTLIIRLENAFDISQISILKKVFVLATGLLDSWKKVVTIKTLSNNGNKATKSEDK